MALWRNVYLNEGVMAMAMKNDINERNGGWP